jgi:serine/threonine protein kinase, bacterial
VSRSLTRPLSRIDNRPVKERVFLVVDIPHPAMTIFCPNGHENPDSHQFCQSCGSKIPKPVGNQIGVGMLLGDRYRVTAEIGQGGFGRTYLCEHTNRFNELCVLKEFAPQVQGTAFLIKAQELFEREAGVMYRLQHPQIPMFREMFRVHQGDVSQLFLVQDYVAGTNYQKLLRHKLQQGKTFTEAEVTQFLAQILPVLGYIHSLGVIHRDISPDNLIQRDRDGLPILIDFGGVKQVAVNAATQYMPAGINNSDIPTRLGKVGYAPNEQMQRGVVSPDSDLYALAATALVLLTGREPPDLIDPQNFTWNWREHVQLQPALAKILDRMLELRPKDRFPAAQDVLTAMQTANLVDGSIGHSAPSLPPIQTPIPIDPKSQIATVVAMPARSESSPLTAVTPATPGLMKILGKTGMAIGAIVGAIGLGWGLANLLTKRPEPAPTRTITITSGYATPSPSSPISSPTPTPTPAPSASVSPTPIASPTSSPTPSGITTVAFIKPIVPMALISQGVNPQAYQDAVKQVFIHQNPKLQVIKIGDPATQSQVDGIATKLGDKLTRQLSNDAGRKIGRYTMTDRSIWRSRLNKLHLSDRALTDLTDAKYDAITEFSAQKLELGFDRFLNTPMGQIYHATMFDRVQAVQAKQAMAEIVFPVGGNSGTVKGKLQPGEGIAYLASLAGGQDIGVSIIANERTKLSIYPPTSKLPPILGLTPTNHWSGKTSMNGYHEFVLVSHSDRPIDYELTLTADDLKK